MNTPCIAIVAPSIQGQFENATFAQIKQGIKMLGFDKVYEAAIGADAIAYYEHEELMDHIEKKIPMTTSCCPAFVNMAKLHFPKIYEENVSTMVSPMMAIARKLKQDYPKHGIVFIGPCVAKKQEAMESFTAVDYVLTFEELAAMMIAKHIHCEELEAAEEEVASVFGRNFAQGGGVSKAVAQAASEKEKPAINAVYADGCMECKKQLMLMKAGKFTGDILEGMSCVGGCINGPGAFETSIKAKARMNKENLSAQKKTIKSVVEEFNFENVHLHREK